MSVESNRHGVDARLLRLEERELLRALLEDRDDFQNVESQLTHALVVDLNDGGMGSLEFVGDQQRVLGVVLAEAEWGDTDGIPLSIVVNADQHGQLFELDIWKVDFSAIKQYPEPKALRFKPLN